MANRKIVNGVKTRGRGRSKPQDWEEDGFVQVDWNKWSYTWEGGNFPVFHIAPGLVPHELGAQSGLVAQYKDTKLYFKYGTSPATIKARLDTEINKIMAHGGLMIDFDDFMRDGE